MEIFSTGTHLSKNGITKTYTETDLDNIVRSYNPEYHEAPITIGHPSDNTPAYGWVQSLKRNGEKLIATVSELLPEFKEMLEKKLFKKRSISLYPDGSLRHIGFLGALPPSVKGLKNLSFQDDEADELLTSLLEETVTESTEGMGHEESVTEAPQLQANTSLNDDQEVEFGNDSSTASSGLEGVESENDSIPPAHKTLDRDIISTLLDSKISEGRFTPAMKRTFFAFIESPDSADQIFEFINSIPVIVHLDEVIKKSVQNYSDHFSGCDDYEIDSHSESIYKKLKSIQHQSGISFEAAINQLIKSNRRAL